MALNEGLRCKKRLWRAGGREQLESFRLAPWASRRRHDLLELLDRLNPTIAELSQAVEREAENNPAARRLMTHPGVGALTALAFVQSLLKFYRGVVRIWRKWLNRRTRGNRMTWERYTVLLRRHPLLPPRIRHAWT